jgi:hypothetical protein
MVFKYPATFEFEAKIVQGSTAELTETSVGTSVKAAPQVSPYVHVRVHPMMVFKVKKLR